MEINRNYRLIEIFEAGNVVILALILNRTERALVVKREVEGMGSAVGSNLHFGDINYINRKERVIEIFDHTPRKEGCGFL